MFHLLKCPQQKGCGRLSVVENYRDYITTTTKKLLIDAELFGLFAMGDGATIVKCPLTNILFAGKYCCLDNLICSLMMVSNKIFHSFFQGGMSSRL